MLDRFAKLLGIRPDQAEDALRSERAAKHVVSRRSFFGAAAALSAGATVFSFAPEHTAPLITAGDYGAVVQTGDRIFQSTRGLVSFDWMLKRIYGGDLLVGMTRGDPLLTMLEKGRPLT